MKHIHMTADYIGSHNIIGMREGKYEKL